MADRPVAPCTVGVERTEIIASALGDDTTGHDCVVTYRRLPGGRNSYSPLSAVAYSPVITDFAGDATRDAGFYVTTEADATLKPGIYQADAYITQGVASIAHIEWLVEVSA